MADGAGHRHSTVMLESLNHYAKTGLANQDFLGLLKRCAIGSTIHLVSNCESVTDWDISSSGVFNATAEGTKIRTGSHALNLITVTTTNGTFVTLDEDRRPNREDWTNFYWLCMWIEDVSALRLTGELMFQISNNGNWSAETAIPVCTTADVAEYHCIDISGLARGSVDGFRFVNRRAGSGETVIIDEIIVTDMITGTGDATQIFTGPVRGNCFVATVKQGETLNPGEMVNFELGHVTAGVDGDAALVGVVCQVDPDVATSWVGSDTAPKEVLIAGIGSILIARMGTAATAGDGMMIESANITLEDGGGTNINLVAKVLETGEDTADNYVQLIQVSLEA